jgi:dihydropteroate synthase
MDFQKLFDFDTPKIMAVINLTPDSFFEKSRAESTKELLQKAEEALVQGADWLDLGAVSTRPNSAHVALNEERQRLLPALEMLVKNFPDTPISIDTFRAEIAKEAYEKGASIINDVSNGQDHALLTFCAQNNMPYVLMHLRGTPNDMMQNTIYEHVVADVYRELHAKMETLKALGMKRIIIDPGFGFSKTLDQNYILMQHLQYFKSMQAPILVGISRKSMIYKLLETTPDEALNGTTVLHTIALLKGANILRVHDVKAAVECVKIVRHMSKHS